MKKKTYFLLLICFLPLASCTHTNKNSSISGQIPLNDSLRNELLQMVKMDQVAANPPAGDLTDDKWKSLKDSVFRTHKLRLEEIFQKYGYPGFNLIGEDGEKSYWLMVQHCDFDPQFQSIVLKALEIEVKKNNADKRNFGLLTDRVRLNRGEKQIYGTQVIYKNYQAVPKPLEDSVNVNKRRKELGFEPIEEYLNMMTAMHFEMNKENAVKHGVTEPKLYKKK
jgi:hypothetical protein